MQPDHFNAAIDTFNLVRAPFVILAALFFLYDWFKRGCWLPAYVHVLAVITFAISCWSFYVIRRDYPVTPPVNAFVDLGIALFLTAIVYVVFILYGGANAALNHREKQKRNAIENADVPATTLRNQAREAARLRADERLHRGWGTGLPIGAALANSIVLVAFMTTFLPLWVAAPAGLVIWAAMVAFFLRTQTYSPEGITFRYIAILAMLIGLWPEVMSK